MNLDSAEAHRGAAGLAALDAAHDGADQADFEGEAVLGRASPSAEVVDAFAGLRSAA